MKTLSILALSLLTLLTPALAVAATQAHEPMDLTNSGLGFAALAVFVFAYLLVMGEEFIHLRKSKPVIIAAGIIWGMIGWYYTQHGMPELAEHAVRHNLLEYAELMLFLLVAMTYVNAMEERRVFDALRSWLVSKGFGFRALFWLTGILAFFISPIADNLTTALLDVCSGTRRRWYKHKICFNRLYQYCCCRQCRRRVFTFWRHHNLNGLAKRNC